MYRKIYIFCLFNCNVQVEKNRIYTYMSVLSIRANELSFHTLTYRPCLMFRYMSRGDYKEFELELKFSFLLKAKIIKYTHQVNTFAQISVAFVLSSTL